MELNLDMVTWPTTQGMCGKLTTNVEYQQLTLHTIDLAPIKPCLGLPIAPCASLLITYFVELGALPVGVIGAFFLLLLPTH